MSYLEDLIANNPGLRRMDAQEVAELQATEDLLAAAGRRGVVLELPDDVTLKQLAGVAHDLGLRVRVVYEEDQDESV